ncbi:unnamed protein product [Cladocopium goreaui]|uniref:Uncharacterized protein n=1 Tax=Cladocopium goreaui TaxID=2562237 RepID=A0A9P1BJS7_9DINO|nr:unnamed protein product [Cladocopium goreaui]
MGQGTHVRDRASSAKMPYRSCDDTESTCTVPISWKRKQRVLVNSGLRALKAPMVVLALCNMVFSCSNLNWNDPQDHLELFAGVCSITRGEWKESRSGVPMDLDFGKDHDILSDAGFSNMVFQVLNLRPGGSMWAAPVCSTSRGSTGRSSSNPMGHGKGTTYLHNLMVGRVAVLLLIAAAKAIWWKLEQPKGSLLEGHLLFQALLRLLQKLKVKITRVSTSLCWFGADTVKPLWVYSSKPEAVEVNDFANKTLVPPKKTKLVIHYKDSKGQPRIKGGPGLKLSQSYPLRFGVAFAKVRSRHQKKHRSEAHRFLRTVVRDGTSAVDPSPKMNKFWVDHANLNPIFSYLSKQQ